MDPFIGQLLLVPYNFAPRGWALCNGQLMSIAQNTALFSLLGTTYGGDGKTTFGLPDLRGRVPISSGQGPGLQNYDLGQMGGAEVVTLLATQMPPHSHPVSAHSGDATQGSPANHLLANSSSYTEQGGNTSMAGTMIGNAGNGQSHENRPPYLTLNWIIALEGIFPSRS